MHEINIQNIELENNTYKIPADNTAMFFTKYSDIVTITNVTVKNHSQNIFCLVSVLTQKFNNCTFNNIIMDDSSTQLFKYMIFTIRMEADVDRNNTEQPVTIFQDFHVDVALDYVIFN